MPSLNQTPAYLSLSLLFVLFSLQGTSMVNHSLHLEEIGIRTEELGTAYFSHDNLDIAIIREERNAYEDQADAVISALCEEANIASMLASFLRRAKLQYIMPPVPKPICGDYVSGMNVSHAQTKYVNCTCFSELSEILVEECKQIGIIKETCQMSLAILSKSKFSNRSNNNNVRQRRKIGTKLLRSTFRTAFPSIIYSGTAVGVANIIFRSGIFGSGENQAALERMQIIERGMNETAKAFIRNGNQILAFVEDQTQINEAQFTMLKKHEQLITQLLERNKVIESDIVALQTKNTFIDALQLAFIALTQTKLRFVEENLSLINAKSCFRDIGQDRHYKEHISEKINQTIDELEQLSGGIKLKWVGQYFESLIDLSTLPHIDQSLTITHVSVPLIDESVQAKLFRIKTEPFIFQQGEIEIAMQLLTSDYYVYFPETKFGFETDIQHMQQISNGHFIFNSEKWSTKQVPILSNMSACLEKIFNKMTDSGKSTIETCFLESAVLPKVPVVLFVSKSKWVAVHCKNIEITEICGTTKNKIIPDSVVFHIRTKCNCRYIFPQFAKQNWCTGQAIVDMRLINNVSILTFEALSHNIEAFKWSSSFNDSAMNTKENEHTINATKALFEIMIKKVNNSEQHSTTVQMKTILKEYSDEMKSIEHELMKKIQLDGSLSNIIHGIIANSGVSILCLAAVIVCCCMRR